jgi:hypothetical protein
MSEDFLKAITDLEDDTDADRHQELAMILSKWEEECVDILRSYGWTCWRKRVEIPV